MTYDTGAGGPQDSEDDPAVLAVAGAVAVVIFCLLGGSISVVAALLLSVLTGTSFWPAWGICLSYTFAALVWFLKDKR